MIRTISALFRWAAISAIVVVSFCFSTNRAPGGVYNDVAAWWHLDMADSGTPTAADIRDQRRWGTANTSGDDWYHATSVPAPAQWTTAGVPAVSPAGGLTHDSRALLLDDSTGAHGFVVGDLRLQGDATLFVRYKWDGSNANGSGAIYRNAFSWSGNQGWLLRMTDAGNPQLYYGQGGSAGQGGVATASFGSVADTWYDFAVVLDENGTNDTITFYRYRAADGAAVEKSVAHVNWFNGDVVSTGPTYVGYESTSNKYFGGELESLAVWRRALNEAEVRDAFGSPNPSWSVGIDNNTNDDLRNENQVDADYTVGEPWHEMRRAVNSAGSDQANVHFSLTADQADLTYVFHLNTNATGGSNQADLALSVNGMDLGTATVGPNAEYRWAVQPYLLNPGANVLGIRYVSGPAAYVSWDWMEFGGAWQVGFDNNSQAEFSTESAAPDDFYVTDPNWKHLERALTAGDPQTNLHFNLSETLIDGLSYQYTTRVISQGGGSHPFDVLVNGELLASLPGQPNGTLLDFIIPSSMLQAGDNVISLVYGDTSGYMQFDFHRFQAAVPEPASAVLLVLGLAALGCLRLRRKAG